MPQYYVTRKRTEITSATVIADSREEAEDLFEDMEAVGEVDYYEDGDIDVEEQHK